MSPKSVLYISILLIGVLVLAVGGWLVTGVKALVGQTKAPERRPRYA